MPNVIPIIGNHEYMMMKALITGLKEVDSAEAIVFIVGHEVQYDYVRFPTGIKEEDLGMNGYGRRRAIFEFVRDAHLKLYFEEMPLSLDVFGTVINSKVDRNIVGQEYSWLSMYCEYLSLMIYPSHYYEGTMGKDYPDLYPYETIDAAMKYSETKGFQY